MKFLLLMESFIQVRGFDFRRVDTVVGTTPRTNHFFLNHYMDRADSNMAANSRATVLVRNEATGV